MKHDFKAGQRFENENTNIFIKRVSGENIAFIEGFSPSAIHNIQEMEAEYLQEYIEKYSFEFTGYYD